MALRPPAETWLSLWHPRRPLKLCLAMRTAAIALGTFLFPVLLAFRFPQWPLLLAKSISRHAHARQQLLHALPADPQPLTNLDLGQSLFEKAARFLGPLLPHHSGKCSGQRLKQTPARPSMLYPRVCATLQSAS